MDQTTKLLSSIAVNARTGFDATDQLLKHTEDERMRDELRYQRDFYEGAEKDAEEKLRGFGEERTEKGPLSRVGMWAGIKMNTLIDHTSSHIADLVIQGATMGVIDTTKARNECPDADQTAQDAASGFITQQQEAIDRMKRFLM